MLKNIFDSHCHYDDKKFKDDCLDVIENAFSTTVSGMIHACVDFDSADFGIKMSEKFKNFYTSVGIHPENLQGLEDDYLSRLEKLCRHEKVKAIGEIGLDYHWEGFDRERQLSVFENQIILANKLALPVIIHLRDATEDGMNLIRKHRPKGVMHCFSGSFETAKEVISLGMYISFTGVLTFKNAKKPRRALEAVPLDRLLLETDCPYMAPEPYRGKRCDSTMISETAKTAAQIKGVPAQELLDITAKNTKTLFNIK